MAKDLMKEIEATKQKLEAQRRQLRIQQMEAETDSQLKALQRQVDHLIAEQNRKKMRRS